MAIDFRKYVRIVSGVGGSAAVSQRDLIGRIFSNNPLISPDAVLEFSGAADVATYFGASSDEARRAAFYFAWVSPSTSSPRRLSFARYGAGVAIAATIFSNTDAKSLTALQAITTGELNMLVDGTAVAITGLDFSAALSFADVASAVQTALNANPAPALASAMVMYDATARRFVITSGVAGAGTLGVADSASDVSAAMGLLLADGAIYTAGAPSMTPVESLAASSNLSDNFGSFVFTATLALPDIIDVAQYNAALNVKFQYCVPVTSADASAWSAALRNIAGVSLTLSPVSGEWPEMIPMIILAATDYAKRNAAPNYMYRVFSGVSPSVNSTPDSDSYDNERINYYGRTQTAGQTIEFYQRGVLMGGPTDPVDMGVYANEQWLKDAAGSALLGLLLALAQLPASNAGRGQVLTVLQGVIDAALFNGTISAGKTLTPTQQVYITQQTGDPLAWHQVQDVGYWVDCVIEPYATEDGRTEYRAVYTLIYSKNDSIRAVSGTHTLI